MSEFNEIISETLKKFKIVSQEGKAILVKEIIKGFDYETTKSLQNFISSHKKYLGRNKSKILSIRDEFVSEYSIDVEKILLIGKKQPIAASLSIYNNKLEQVYSVLIKHEPKTIRDTVEPITGFNKNSFINGQPIDLVRRNIVSLIGNNLIVGFAIKDDLESLGLDSGNFNTLELQEFYRKTSNINPHTQESLGLRHMIYHYYNIDIHSGEHQASTDALYTMKLYLEHYKYDVEDENITFERVERLPKIPFKIRLEKLKKKVHFE